MYKQEKVTKKINSKTAGNFNIMYKGKVNKNDEFYTSLNDIMTELCKWGPKFTGKNIICPCDCDIFSDGDDIYSIKISFNENSKASITSKTWEEFEPECIEWPDEIETFINDCIEINSVNIKHDQISLFATPDTGSLTRITDYSEIKEIISKRITCNFIKALYSLGCEYGIKSITASGYNTAECKGVRFQDVDYSNYDICITNPPFSIYSEFMSKMIFERDSRINTDKPFDFILLAPMNNRANPCVGLYLMLKKCYLGYGKGLHMNFTNPDKEDKLKSKIVCVDWITTFDEAQKEVNLLDYKSGISYEMYKADYKLMENITMKDGTHPIRVKQSTIPYDYDGWMFGPVGVLDKLNMDKYEWYLTNAKGYFNTAHPELNPCTHKFSEDMLKVSWQPKVCFHGILFKKKVN